MCARAPCSSPPRSAQLAAAEDVVKSHRSEVAVLRGDSAISARDQEIGELRAKLAEAEQVKEELASLLEEVRNPRSCAPPQSPRSRFVVDPPPLTHTPVLCIARTH